MRPTNVVERRARQEEENALPRGEYQTWSPMTTTVSIDDKIVIQQQHHR